MQLIKITWHIICSLLLFSEYLKSFYRCKSLKHWFVEGSCRSGMQMSADVCLSLCFLPHPIQALDCSVVFSQLGNIFLIRAKFFLILSGYHPRPIGETTFHTFQGEKGGCYRLENNVSYEKYSFFVLLYKACGDLVGGSAAGPRAVGTLRGSKHSMWGLGVKKILGVPKQVGLDLHWAPPTPEALCAPLNDLHGRLTSSGRAGLGVVNQGDPP